MVPADDAVNPWPVWAGGDFFMSGQIKPRKSSASWRETMRCGVGGKWRYWVFGVGKSFSSKFKTPANVSRELIPAFILEVVTMLFLYSQKEFADKIGRDDRKLRVYYLRGKLPEPFAMVGGENGRPVWTLEQINKYKAGMKE
jgi:hypothetical protein